MRIRLALIALAGLAVAACGNAADETAATRDSNASGARGGDTEATAEPVGSVAQASDSVLPAVEVIEVTTEERVNLASLVPNDKPILLWFWAPH